jgi:hypothetical protein
MSIDKNQSQATRLKSNTNRCARICWQWRKNGGSKEDFIKLWNESFESAYQAILAKKGDPVKMDKPEKPKKEVKVRPAPKPTKKAAAKKSKNTVHKVLKEAPESQEQAES